MNRIYMFTHLHLRTWRQCKMLSLYLTNVTYSEPVHAYKWVGKCTFIKVQSLPT